MNDIYETVIGLEIHVELATNTKIFCGCSTAFGKAPNTLICPICTGMPGALPVLNSKVLEYAVSVGMALNCEIAKKCRFDRKNYFYPDNPQNYQISQLYFPFCRNGKLEIETENGRKEIGIHEIHMEEDAGKLIHDEKTGETLIDYNRSGVPLIEIVTEPDFRSAEEVIAFLDKLRYIITYLKASDCKLQEGSMRVDVNLSLREKGSEMLGTRTEMKNLNSFHAIADAIHSEANRQADVLNRGERVCQETRRWNEDKNISIPMRRKEEANDYRYFPEPDLMPIWIEEAYLEKIKASMPEFREEKAARFVQMYEVTEKEADILTQSLDFADFFETTTKCGVSSRKVCNWLLTETLRLLKEKNLDPEDITFSPEGLAELIALTDEKVINSTVAKQVFEVMFDRNVSPKEYVEKMGLATVSDEALLEEVIDKVLAENTKSVEDYRNGKEKAIGFLVGMTMKAMQGKANPMTVNKILVEKLKQLTISH